MKTTNWFETYQTLKQQGVDPLNEQEQSLRRLPIKDVQTVENVFQPRQFDDGTAQSGKHIDELKRGLRTARELDPVTIMKIGGRWVCIDGHHRLEAYRQAGGRRTHIPVKVFSGGLDDALRFSIAVNAPDKLNLTREDKWEAAWRMLLLDTFTYDQISEATKTAKGTIHNMNDARKELVAAWGDGHIEVWTWRKIKEYRNKFGTKEGNNMWQEAKVKEWGRQIARNFGGLPSKHPRVFARALLAYNADAAKAIANEIYTVVQVASVDNEPDF